MLYLLNGIILLTLLLSGCSSVPKKPRGLIDSLSATAIVTAATKPDIDFDTFAKGRWVGAGKGFLTGTGVLVGTTLIGAVQGSPGTPLGTVIGAGLGAAVGAVLLPYYVAKGAMRAIPGDEAKRIQSSLRQSVLDANPQENLARQVAETGNQMAGNRLTLVANFHSTGGQRRPYRSSDFSGFDSVLEVAVNKIAYTDGESHNPDIAFFMSASARLVQLSTSRTIYEQHYDFRSPNRPWSDWLKNDGLEITVVFEDACLYLGKQIAEGFFQNKTNSPD